MRDYFAYWWAILRDLFNRERIPLEDLIDEDADERNNS